MHAGHDMCAAKLVGIPLCKLRTSDPGGPLLWKAGLLPSHVASGKDPVHKNGLSLSDT